MRRKNNDFLHLGNFACVNVCLRLFVTLVHYLQFILVVERMKHRPFSKKDETSSFLYPAEFLSGVTSYEKSQSALHR